MRSTRPRVAAAVAGADAVIQSLGAPKGPQAILSGTTLFSRATRILIDAMRENGVRRLVTVTGLGAGDSRGHGSFLYDAMVFPLVLKRVYDDKDVQEQMIRASGLEWTIARPGLLTSGPATGQARALVDPKDWRAGSISRADVADFLVREAFERRFVGKTPSSHPMSRWANDPEAAADELIRRSLDAIDLKGRVLLANHAGALPALLAERGVAAALWNRRLAGSAKAQAWPPAGPFDVALLRLPKAKDEQEMAAHACLSVLAPGGRLIVYGGNDEGIRSAGGMLERLCGEVETLATRGHGRVLAARRPADTAPSARLAGGLALDRAARRSPARVRDWVSYPGVFAAGRIDEGTALLIGALPPLRPGDRVLDYGCGSGVIGAAALAAAPGIALDLLDNDAVALEAARENVAGARLLLGTQARRRRPHDYDAILSNPPLHKGIAEDHALLEQLIADAPAHLRPGGFLQIVVQRRVPLERLLAERIRSRRGRRPRPAAIACGGRAGS